MASASCEICGSEFFKYRCSICRSRSCCLQCFQKHEGECETSAVRTHDGRGDSITAVKISDPKTPDSEVAKSSDSRPDRRDDLNTMFTRYPTLRAKLKSIYESTQDPGLKAESQAGGAGYHERRWSEEKGFNHGMALLQRQLESEDADSEDLRSFAAYIAANTG